MNARPSPAARALLEHLEARGIRDPRVLAAMARVPRDRFCPPGQRELAWADTVVPLAPGATLSEPFVVAVMLEALDLRGGERVLDVGSGSGYTTALLCELAGAVHAVERQPDLAGGARRLLAELGYQNCTVCCGDGWAGRMDRFPYNGILVSAAVPSWPPALLDQLAPSGRIVAPVGPPDCQQLRVLRSAGPEGKAVLRDLLAVRFLPLERSGHP